MTTIMISCLLVLPGYQIDVSRNRATMVREICSSLVEISTLISSHDFKRDERKHEQANNLILKCRSYGRNYFDSVSVELSTRGLDGDLAVCDAFILYLTSFIAKDKVKGAMLNEAYPSLEGFIYGLERKKWPWGFESGSQKLNFSGIPFISAGNFSLTSLWSNIVSNHFDKLCIE